MAKPFYSSSHRKTACRSWLPWLWLLLALTAACSQGNGNAPQGTAAPLASPTSPLISTPTSSPLPQLAAATHQAQAVVQVKKLSDFPLYEAHLQGDYGFQKHLQPAAAPAAKLPYIEKQYACSTFAALGDPQQRLLGRNFDWYEHPALILFTHPPGAFASVSMVDLHYLDYTQAVTPLTDPQPLQQAPYFPFDGMNEHGLAVGMMAVPRAEGPQHPGAVTLDELELIRLMLDYAQDVPSALELVQAYNISFGSVPIHYLVADAAGNSAVLEYLDGALTVLNNQHPWQTATNFLLREENPQAGDSSCWRYNKMYSVLEKAGGVFDPLSAMNLLETVSQPGSASTRWSIVYELTRRQARLAVGRDYSTIFSFNLSQ